MSFFFDSFVLSAVLLAVTASLDTFSSQDLGLRCGEIISEPLSFGGDDSKKIIFSGAATGHLQHVFQVLDIVTNMLFLFCCLQPSQALTLETDVGGNFQSEAVRVLSGCTVSEGVAASGGAECSGDPQAKEISLLEKLQQAVGRMKAGGEIPCHLTTLTTAIYHWQDLAKKMEKYDGAVTQRRQGQSDPLEPAERKFSVERRRVLRYPGVVVWFTGNTWNCFISVSRHHHHHHHHHHLIITIVIIITAPSAAAAAAAATFSSSSSSSAPSSLSPSSS